MASTRTGGTSTARRVARQQQNVQRELELKQERERIQHEQRTRRKRQPGLRIKHYNITDTNDNDDDLIKLVKTYINKPSAYRGRYTQWDTVCLLELYHKHSPTWKHTDILQYIKDNPSSALATDYWTALRVLNRIGYGIGAYGRRRNRWEGIARAIAAGEHFGTEEEREEYDEGERASSEIQNAVDESDVDDYSEEAPDVDIWDFEQTCVKKADSNLTGGSSLDSIRSPSLFEQEQEQEEQEHIQDSDGEASTQSLSSESESQTESEQDVNEEPLSWKEKREKADWKAIIRGSDLEAVTRLTFPSIMALRSVHSDSDDTTSTYKGYTSDKYKLNTSTLGSSSSSSSSEDTNTTTTPHQRITRSITHALDRKRANAAIIPPLLSWRQIATLRHRRNNNAAPQHTHPMRTSTISVPRGGFLNRIDTDDDDDDEYIPVHETRRMYPITIDNTTGLRVPSLSPPLRPLPSPYTLHTREARAAIRQQEQTIEHKLRDETKLAKKLQEEETIQRTTYKLSKLCDITAAAASTDTDSDTTDTRTSNKLYTPRKIRKSIPARYPSPSAIIFTSKSE